MPWCRPGLRRLLPGIWRRGNLSKTQSPTRNKVFAKKKAAKAVNSPEERFTAKAAYSGEGANMVTMRSTNIHVGLPGG